jgi:hypothetical protein
MLRTVPGSEVSQREVFAAWSRAHGGKRHADDVPPPEMPSALAYLMDWFWQLHPGRPVTTAGFMPIPMVEIDAWSRLNGIRLRSWELRVLRLLDGTFIRVMGEK